MRLAGSLACLVLLTGFAPIEAGAPPEDAASAHRCFASTDARLVKFEAGSGVYIRARTGQVLELAGPGPCLDVTDEPRIGLRPMGLPGADICVGDALRLDISSHASIRRTCNVRVGRVVPDGEVAGISGRRS